MESAATYCVLRRSSPYYMFQSSGGHQDGVSASGVVEHLLHLIPLRAVERAAVSLRLTLRSVLRKHNEGHYLITSDSEVALSTVASSFGLRRD